MKSFLTGSTLQAGDLFNDTVGGRPAVSELELPGEEELETSAAIFTTHGLRCELP